ncbi:putative membrane protein [Pseudonocardia sediminis]|uniref:Putative membrane protein n=1 Tax=Pseudonocardia sediminis TaxID=1397368 RepID=A0A4Q7UXB0_PSEST|nr:MauE/DoxX family redox-associated membrane protein [Pseudonocardia sediminis]RZT84823.1 putative membrane protein [Pseudonocardia sediminis]
MTTRQVWAARFLAAFLGVAGVAHFVVPDPFDAMIPGPLPGDPRFWTYLSGVAELTVAGLIAVPRTRRVGGYAAVALFVAVFPANIAMAIDWSDRSAGQQAIAYGRLPLQIPLIWWAWRVARPRVRGRVSDGPGRVTA